MKKESTASYQWQGGGIIQRVDIRTQDNGRAVAYIYADDSNARQPERNAVRTAFRGKGWGTLSDHSGDQFSLRVSGITDPQNLIRLITEQDYVRGSPAVTSSIPEGAKAKGVADFIKTNSLRASGIIYMLGNAMYYMSGRAAKSPSDKNMAISFAAGDALLSLYGDHDDARQFKSLLGKLQKHMEADGIEIPATASIKVETSKKNQTLFSKSNDFIHEHINPLKISAEILGGYFALQDGLGKNVLKESNPWKAWGGAVVIAGWTGALLTKEKKPDKEKLQHASATERAIAYIQEKPLRLAGWAGLTFNGLNFKSKWAKRDTEAGKWTMGAVGAMVSANGLYSISNKTTGGNIKEDVMVSDVYSVAAQIINKQPDLQREAAIESTAKFLGERPEIKDTHSEIIARLNKEVLIQRQNPWFENTRLAIRPVEETAAAAKKHHAMTTDVNLATAEAPQTAIHTASSVHQARLEPYPAALGQPTVAAL